MKKFPLKTGLMAAVLTLASAPGQALAALSFAEAVEQAIAIDPRLKALGHQVEARQHQSVAVQQLPDPKLSLQMASLPVDSFNLDQEAMTQLKVGVSQQFPRGDSLAIKATKQQLAATGLQYAQQARIAAIRRDVGNLWLDSYYWRQVQQLITDNYGLFEHLIEVSNNQYASGSNRLGDVVRAELELTRLDDRLTRVGLKQAQIQGQLSGWLTLPSLAITHQLPALQAPVLPRDDFNALSQQVIDHPLLHAARQEIEQMQQQELLAKQAYEPAYTLSGSYGLRQDGDNGVDRANLLSVGISMDLPLFTELRQDKALQSAEASTRSAQFVRTDLHRQLSGELQGLVKRLDRLQKRYALYEERLLKQMNEQTQASLTAYTNNQGDFSEVMRSSIAKLNADIDHQMVKIDLLKTVNNMHYLLTRANQVNHYE